MGRGGEEVRDRETDRQRELASKDDGDEAGWYDDDGFWFEPAADGAEGFYDCYDPEGQLYETGSYAADGTWVKVHGQYDAHGHWQPAEAEPLPGQVPQAAAAKREAPPPRAAGLVLETNEQGEQGYFYKGRWICVGWYDADGYWFEEAGEVNEAGEFVANGYHDCYDENGDWFETGFWTADDTWSKCYGYYDDDGAWVDEEPPPEEKPMPKPKKTAGEESESGDEDDVDAKVYKGQLHLGKNGKGGKYAADGGAKKGGLKGVSFKGSLKSSSLKSNSWKRDPSWKNSASWKNGISFKSSSYKSNQPDMTVNGEPILICDMAGATYNDLPWAILFALMVIGTAGLAAYKNFMGGTEMDVVSYCDTEPCKNGGTCKELSVLVNGHVGYQCLCSGGWLGDTCEKAPVAACTTCEGFVNGTEVIMDSGSSLQLTDSQLHNFVGMSVSAVAAGTLWGVAFLHIIRAYTKQIIWITMIMMVVAQLGLSAVFFIFGVPQLGVICFLAGLISVLIIVVVRNWIPFATLLIRTACLVVKKNPAVLKIALMAVVTQAIWLVIWVFAATSSIGSSDTTATFVCLVSLFWSVQVIKNVVHVTCAGTVASWYFVTNERRATLAAFRRSITYSFGSICFGSLIVAILKAIRAMIPRRPSATNGGFSQMFLRGMLGCVEKLMEWLNHYAFTQIAIYGYDFRRAAKATWQLLQDVGLMPLMNNTLVQAVCWLGCIIGAAIASLISVMMVKSTDLDGTMPLWVAGSFGAMVGFVMVMPIIEVIESMVTALFICYAYNADVLLMNDPLLYQEITKAYDLMAADMNGDYAEDEVEEFDEEEGWDDEHYGEEEKGRQEVLEEETSSGEEEASEYETTSEEEESGNFARKR